MSYNAKNYTEQGGDVTHIGGKLVFESGSSIEGIGPTTNQPNSEAATVDELKNDFNDLLDRLKAAGLMLPDESESEPEPDASPEDSE